MQPHFISCMKRCQLSNILGKENEFSPLSRHRFVDGLFYEKHFFLSNGLLKSSNIFFKIVVVHIKILSMDLFGDNKHLSCKLHQNELRVYHSIAQHITLDTAVQLFDCAMDFQFLYCFHVEICMSPSKYLHFINFSLRFYAEIKSAFLVSFTKPILI